MIAARVLELEPEAAGFRVRAVHAGAQGAEQRRLGARAALLRHVRALPGHHRAEKPVSEDAPEGLLALPAPGRLTKTGKGMCHDYPPRPPFEADCGAAIRRQQAGRAHSSAASRQASASQHRLSLIQIKLPRGVWIDRHPIPR
jgi:hypothetical protein